MSQVRRLLDVTGVSFLVVDAAHAHIRPAASWFASDAVRAAFVPVLDRPYEPERAGVTEAAIESGSPVRIERMEDWPGATGLHDRLFERLDAGSAERLWDWYRSSSFLSCPRAYARRAHPRRAGARALAAAARVQRRGPAGHTGARGPRGVRARTWPAARRRGVARARLAGGQRLAGPGRGVVAALDAQVRDSDRRGERCATTPRTPPAGCAAAPSRCSTGARGARAAGARRAAVRRADRDRRARRVRARRRRAAGRTRASRGGGARQRARLRPRAPRRAGDDRGVRPAAPARARRPRGRASSARARRPPGHGAATCSASGRSPAAASGCSSATSAAAGSRWRRPPRWCASSSRRARSTATARPTCSSRPTRSFCSRLPEGLFLPTFLAIADGRRLRWCNAGHPPPHLLRADGRRGRRARHDRAAARHRPRTPPTRSAPVPSPPATCSSPRPTACGRRAATACSSATSGSPACSPSQGHALAPQAAGGRLRDEAHAWSPAARRRPRRAERCGCGGERGAARGGARTGRRRARCGPSTWPCWQERLDVPRRGSRAHPRPVGVLRRARLRPGWWPTRARDPVACGGLRALDAETGEIKRMFVTSRARGRGHARALLAELERRAAAAGQRRAAPHYHRGARTRPARSTRPRATRSWRSPREGDRQDLKDGEAARLIERVVERAQQQLGVRVGDHERRLDLEHVLVRPVGRDQDAARLEAP